MLYEYTSVSNNALEYHYDTLIVGSGYGGAIAAAELAGYELNGQPQSVCVLERGREYLPGMFPASMTDMPTAVRFSGPSDQEAHGEKEALFDVRIGEDVSAVLGSGLGGGSLINAGVMEVPRREVFSKGWPDEFKQDLTDYYERAKIMLGAADQEGLNTIKRHFKKPPLKYQVMRDLAEKNKQEVKFRDAAITVSMEDKKNDAGISLKACNFCGDCASGCNYQAKESLDTNLLVTAVKKGAHVFTGATVHKFEKHENGWLVYVTHTEKRLRRRQKEPTVLKVKNLIISAGTYGSTEILMRSQSESLKFSDRLGENYSANGDMLATGTSSNEETVVNAVARNSKPANTREIGPTCTTVIEAMCDENQEPLLIEELGIPASLKFIFEELVTTTNSMSRLVTRDKSFQRNGVPLKDHFAVDDDQIDRTVVYAVMGDDNADGKLQLNADKDDLYSDGTLNTKWPEVRNKRIFSKQLNKLETLTKGSNLEGNISSLWQYLPKSMIFLTNNEKGPVLTVHPLGGCAMGANSKDGVVDHRGRVFDGKGQSHETHPGLLVLDGAIIPSALGVNPALTIAVLALRAIEGVRQDWGLTRGSEYENSVSVGNRPILDKAYPLYGMTAKEALEEDHVPTEIQIIERTVGEVWLKSFNDKPRPWIFEITLSFENKDVMELAKMKSADLLVAKECLDTGVKSELRIYQPHEWKRIKQSGLRGNRLELALEKTADATIPLSGRLSVMQLRRSSSFGRTARALYAWVLNRGLRDTWQALKEDKGVSADSQDAKKNTLSIICQGITNAIKLASHAGEARSLDYELVLGKAAYKQPHTPLKSILDTSENAQIKGSKVLTYKRASNPLRQLMDMTLTDFPGLYSGGKQTAVLSLDVGFLAHIAVPLLRVVKHRDLSASTLDFISLALYFFRAIISIHLWSFRLPDSYVEKPSYGTLPVPLDGLPQPQRIPLTVSYTEQDEAVQILLTRYKGKSEASKPLVLFHGFSTGGNTFAHPALEPSFAEYMWHKGHDIWIVELRTSHALETASKQWSFETVAYEDMPVAIDYIYQATGGQRCNVVAHCMGATTMIIALLADNNQADAYRHSDKRQALPDKINRLITTQAGLSMFASPGSQFRSYLFDLYWRVLPMDQYQYNTDKKSNVSDSLLDRLLAVLPYKNKEFIRKNPLTPWKVAPYTKTLHRVDALFNQLFSVSQVSDNVLCHLDDFFGDFNMETLGKTIHFAKAGSVTDDNGRNDFTSPQKIQNCLRFPILHIHGEDNALFDVSSAKRTERLLRSSQYPTEVEIFEGIGHQDLWIGKNSVKVYERVEAFLQKQIDSVSSPPFPVFECQLALPSLGPIIGHWKNKTNIDCLPILCGRDPFNPKPDYILVVPLINSTSIGGVQYQNGNGMFVSPFIKSIAFDEHGICNLSLSSALWEPNTTGMLILMLSDISIRSQATPEINDIVSMAESSLSSELKATIARELKSYIESQADDIRAGLIESVPEKYVKRDSNLCFIHGSCQYPSWVIDGYMADDSYRRLSKRLDTQASNQRPQFMTLVGDQIYADPSTGLFAENDLFERYTKPYEVLYGNQYVRSVRRRLPAHTMLDDHEIETDWEPIPGDVENDQNMRIGVASFMRYQNVSQLSNEGRLWYTSKHNGYAFFTLDTRTERTPRTAANIETAKLIADEQYQHLTEWLIKNKELNKPVFILSPSTFLPRHAVAVEGKTSAASIKSDGWTGYPETLNRLLVFIAENKINNIVFLCGDEHLSCVSKAVIKDTQMKTAAEINIIISSAFYAPYTFANSRPWDLAANESFSFSNLSNPCDGYRCNVSTDFIKHGDGFCLVEVMEKKDHSEVHCEFDRSHGNYKRVILLPKKIEKNEANVEQDSDIENLVCL